MKIVVCLKQVPDTTEVRLDPKTNTLIREGIPSIINPDDKAGLEAALKLRDSVGGSVVAVCMGPPQAEYALREALAMGSDEAILVSAREFGGSDTYATSEILSAAMKTVGYDLIITGRQAIDGDTAQVGPQLAEKLQVPQVTYVQNICVDNGNIIVERQFEDCFHRIQLTTPCLITVLSELGNPRYMTVGGIVDAYNKTIKTLGFADLKDNLNLDSIGLAGSPTKVDKSFTKQAKAKGIKEEGLSSDEAAELIANKIAELQLV